MMDKSLVKVEFSIEEESGMKMEVSQEMKHSDAKKMMMEVKNGIMRGSGMEPKSKTGMKSKSNSVFSGSKNEGKM